MLYNLLDLSWTVTPEFEKMRNRSNDCTENDIDNFVEICFRQVAEDLGVKFKDIKDILYGRNIEFFEEKARLFNDSDSIFYNDSELKDLMKKFKIPNTVVYSNLTPATKFLRNFKELSAKDKVEILEALSYMRVTLPTGSLSKATRVDNFLIQFKELTETQKYEAIKHLFKIDVNANE